MWAKITLQLKQKKRKNENDNEIKQQFYSIRAASCVFFEAYVTYTQSAAATNNKTTHTDTNTDTLLTYTHTSHTYTFNSTFTIRKYYFEALSMILQQFLHNLHIYICTYICEMDLYTHTHTYWYTHTHTPVYLLAEMFYSFLSWITLNQSTVYTNIECTFYTYMYIHIYIYICIINT